MFLIKYDPRDRNISPVLGKDKISNFENFGTVNKILFLSIVFPNLIFLSKFNRIALQALHEITDYLIFSFCLSKFVIFVLF